MNADLKELSNHYRKIRKAVFEEATKPFDGNPSSHIANKLLVREKITRICNDADLSKYEGCGPGVASDIWKHMWTKIRYAGIQSRIATKEIEDINFCFQDFERFSRASWDIRASGYSVQHSGEDVIHFLNRSGLFKDCQTIGNVPKLCKTVSLARALSTFLRSESLDRPTLHFITSGLSKDDVWGIHAHLLSIGYKADLTALHLMMDLGFQVIKPDIVITSQFLDWGWLHRIVPGLPDDLSVDDLHGEGNYGTKYQYTNKRIYKPVIRLAKEIVSVTSKNQLIDDIGWATDNPLREFDIFIVKHGQEPEYDFGIMRRLHKGSAPLKGSLCHTVV